MRAREANTLLSALIVSLKIGRVARLGDLPNKDRLSAIQTGPRTAFVLSPVLRGPRFTMTHLNGTGVEDFVVKKTKYSEVALAREISLNPGASWPS
jgi:hypothetical protein